MSSMEQRWPRTRPVLADLVAAAKAGSGREVLDRFMSKIYCCDGTVNSVVEAFAPPATTPSCNASANLLPLEGLPFLVKDNLDVNGFHTVCGSTLYVNNPPATHDCKIVADLRDLGAIPVGKTNVPPLSYDVQTFNDVYGTTSNPYSAHLTAGGSSGGSAAAVSLGLAAFSVGSDWVGSLRIPAGFCGVCSLKASRGRMSIDGRDHTLPQIAEDPECFGHVLVQGLFTKTVTDLRFCMGPLLQSSLQTGPGSSVSIDGHVGKAASIGRRPQDVKESGDLGHQRITVGVVASFPGLPLDHRIEGAMRKIPLWLSESPPDVGASGVEAVMITDFSLDFQQIRQAMKVFFSMLTQTNAIGSREHLAKLEWAKSLQARSSGAVDALLEKRGFSALVAPVCAVLPPEHNHKHAPVRVNDVEEPYWHAMCAYTEPFSLSGNPVVTIPLCWIEGKPCGIQVIGKMGDDEGLLKTCMELERHLHVEDPISQSCMGHL